MTSEAPSHEGTSTPHPCVQRSGPSEAPETTSHASEKRHSGSECELITSCSTHIPSQVFSLPDETLLAVLHLLVKPAAADLYNGNQDLWNASCVCRCWRGVAISDSALWTEISTYNSSLARIFLARSQHAALRLLIVPAHQEVSSGHMRNSARNDIVANWYRISRLTILEDNQGIKAWMDRFVGAGPASLLDQLVVDLGTRGTMSTIRFPYYPPATVMPHLRSLTSRGGSLYPVPPDLGSNLEVLVLSSVHSHLAINTLLASLKATPNLRTLKLLDIEAPPHVPKLVPGPIVLRNLQQLMVSNNLALGTALLQDLILPTVVSIELQGEDTLEETVFLRFPRDRSSHPWIADIRYLVFQGGRIGGEWGCIIHGYRDVPPVRERPGSETATPLLKLDLGDHIHGETLPALFEWLSHDAANIEAFVLMNVISSVSPEDWVYILRHMAGLKSLRLIMCPDATVTLLDVLRGPDAPAYSHLATPPDLLPALESLELSEFSPSAPANASLSTDQLAHRTSTVTITKFWRSLRGMVERKRACGVPLRSLSLFVVDAPSGDERRGVEEIRDGVEDFRFYVPSSEGMSLKWFGTTYRARKSEGYGRLEDDTVRGYLVDFFDGVGRGSGS